MILIWEKLKGYNREHNWGDGSCERERRKETKGKKRTRKNRCTWIRRTTRAKKHHMIWVKSPSCTPAPATQPNRIRRQLHNDTLLTITNNFISHRLMGLGSGHSTSLRKSVINHVPCILISLIYFIILYLISLFITYIYIYIFWYYFYSFIFLVFIYLYLNFIYLYHY